MNYSLGNMLGGAGALNADKLSLDLQFATDKTLTARKGPTPTFTRASGATEVGSDGLIRYAPENLLLRSQEFNLTWAVNNAMTVTADAVTAPDGTLTADAINFDTNALSRILQFAGSAAVHTFSVWLRANAATTCILDAQGTGVTSAPITVNITTSWQRFTFVANNFANGTSGWNIRIQNNALGTTGTIFAWGAQLERHTSARAYIPTTSAVVYNARFDHDPVTFASKGLLIEESRTNLAVRSDDFANASWTQLQATIASNVIASPDGSTNADRLDEDTSATTQHQVIQQAPTLTAGQPYTFSVFAKAASHTSFQMVFSTAAFGTGLFANFVLSGSGSVGASSGVTTKIEQYSNGWYRCSITVASVTGGTGGFIQCVANNNNSSLGRLPAYTGTGAQAVYLWGAQLELGLFPTSYIPTTTASVVRSADVCSITGSALTSFYNQSEGTIVGSGLTNQPTNNAGPQLFRANDGTSNNVIQIGMTNVAVEAVRPIITASGTTTYNNRNGTATVGVERKIGTAYKTDDAISAFNGTLGTLDTTVTLPTNCNQVVLFSGLGAGTISSLRYYKKRLSNAKLQTLTTL